MSEQSVDPGFYDSVVTTSAHTSVDTDELIGAALGVMMAKETAQNCYASLMVIQLMASSAVMLGFDPPHRRGGGCDDCCECARCASGIFE